jgi:FLYWCH zinc finger domain
MSFSNTFLIFLSFTSPPDIIEETELHKDTTLSILSGDDDNREVYYVSYLQMGGHSVLGQSDAPLINIDEDIKPKLMRQKPRPRKRAPIPVRHSTDGTPVFDPSGRGNNILCFEGHRYIKNNRHLNRVYWKCTKWHTGCKARAITLTDTTECVLKNSHNHSLLMGSVEEAVKEEDIDL